MRRAWLLVALVFVGTVGFATAPAATACSRTFLATTGSSCQGELAWRYDANAQAFVKEGTRIGALDDLEAGVRYDYVSTLRCEEGSLCGASAYTCPVRDGVRGLMYVALAFRLGADGSRLPGVPPIRSTYCDYPGESVSVGVVQAVAHEEVRRRLVAPVVVSWPPGRGLVGLLTIFSSPVQPEPVIGISRPVPGEIRARPAYVWDFGDGLSGVGPGVAYEVGDVPSRVPGKYLGAMYVSGGVKRVSVTVTWSVQFRLEGVVDVPLAPIVFTASQDKEIATARAVLVR